MVRSVEIMEEVEIHYNFYDETLINTWSVKFSGQCPLFFPVIAGRRQGKLMRSRHFELLVFFVIYYF